MDEHLNREIKAFCPDFEPIRRILRDSGAVFIETKTQVDRYYRLTKREEEDGARRLKLRVEGVKQELIYYRENHEADTRLSEVRIWRMPKREVIDVLDAVLGDRVVVRKKRELWRKHNIIFNLDRVEGVGQIFELEAQDRAGFDPSAQVEEYRRLMLPHLGSYVGCSNEDLVIGGS